MILIERFQDEAGYRIAQDLGKNYGKKTEVQDEDTHHCVLRERGNEIQVALSAGVPVLLQTTNEQINRLLVGDIAIDDTAEIQSICRGKKALLRHYPYRTEMEILGNLDALLGKKVAEPTGQLLSIADVGCTNIISDEEYEQIERWPHYVGEKYTHRTVKNYSVESFGELKQYFNERGFTGPDGYHFPYPVFIKTQMKGGSHVVQRYGDFGHMGIYGMHQDYFVSSCIDIAEDENYEKKEYRTYVVGGNAINAARIPRDYEEEEIPDGLLEFAQQFAQEHRTHFQSYVLDIAVLKDGKFAVVELNNLSLAGRHFGNKFEPILQACMKI